MNRLLSIFFPNHCPYCSELIPYNMNECKCCRATFPLEPQVELTPTGEICIAPFVYDGKVRLAIEGFKFRGRLSNGCSLSAAISRAVKMTYGKDMDYELVTCVPMSNDRKRKRGFNQSEVLAEKAAAELQKPFIRLLKRESGAPVQHELSYKERIAQRSDTTIHLTDPELVKGKSILLIDDVMTTGTTLSNCCRILHEGGAARILCAVAAMTRSYGFDKKM